MGVEPTWYEVEARSVCLSCHHRLLVADEGVEPSAMDYEPIMLNRYTNPQYMVGMEGVEPSRRSIGF